MNYVYDILVNLDNKYYEFYEWNETDEILHIKKIPILRVESDVLKSIKYGTVVFDKKVLDKIYKKTDFFKNNKCNKYNYICALSDCKQALVVSFDIGGKVLQKSSLLIDEENEIVEISKCMMVTNIDFNVVNVANDIEFKTRKELEINNYIKKELDVIDDDKLKYLYFECFNEKERDVEKVFDRILFEIDNNFDSIYNKVYDFLKLTSINK